MQPAKINKRPCTRIQVTHQEKKPGLDFHIARIFVDDEFRVPVRYEHEYGDADYIVVVDEPHPMLPFAKPGSRLRVIEDLIVDWKKRD